MYKITGAILEYETKQRNQVERLKTIQSYLVRTLFHVMASKEKEFNSIELLTLHETDDSISQR